MKELMKYASLLIAAIVAFAFLIGGWGTVPAGHRGVEVRMGKVTGNVLGEGFYTKTPFVVRVHDMEVRVQKEQVTTEGASKDLQMVKIVAALNYSPVPEKMSDIFRDVGEKYMERIVDPAMQESIKAVLAQHTAEELITQREIVRSGIKELLATKLKPSGINVHEFNVVNFDFSKSFNDAIEAKVTAEQSALAAKNKLAQVQFEAEQKVAEAKGKAEAIRVESEALAKNQNVLQLRALEKWDGVLPRVSGGAVPFIDVTALSGHVAASR